MPVTLLPGAPRVQETLTRCGWQELGGPGSSRLLHCSGASWVLRVWLCSLGPEALWAGLWGPGISLLFPGLNVTPIWQQLYPNRPYPASASNAQKCSLKEHWVFWDQTEMAGAFRCLWVCTAARRGFTHSLMFRLLSSACILFHGTSVLSSIKLLDKLIEMVPNLRSYAQEENSNMVMVYFIKAEIVFNEKWSLTLTCCLCHRHTDLSVCIPPFLHKIETKWFLFLLPLCPIPSWLSLCLVGLVQGRLLMAAELGQKLKKQGSWRPQTSHTSMPDYNP